MESNVEKFYISVASSVAAAIILALLGKIFGLWWKTKKPASIELATKVLKFLDGEAEEKTTAVVYASKQLGDSLVNFYKNNLPFKLELEQEILSSLNDLVKKIKAFSTELSAADAELDNLKKSVIEYEKALEWRAQIVKHLCHPPNPPAMDAGAVREQLLSVNVVPHDLLNAAKGEALLFLRGYSIGWLARRKYLRDIKKKHLQVFKESVAKEYRSVLQQTAKHSAKK